MRRPLPFLTVTLTAVCLAWAAPPKRNGTSPSQRNASGILLSEVPFLFTHDSATGYIGSHDIEKGFFQTQGVELTTQLTCGARALDIRVLLDHDGAIRYHHGELLAWVSDQTLDNTLPGLVQWSQDHPTELVLLMLSHCYTRKFIGLKWEHVSCTDSRLMGAFTKQGIKAATDCSTINAWTAAEATQHATMERGGKMLVIPGEDYCLSANFDEGVNKRELVKPYVERTMQASRSGHHLFSVQAFVQQRLTVPLADSAVLNPDIVQWLTHGDILRGVNLLEINLVCASGVLISKALGAVVSESDQNTCISHCQNWCKKHGCSPVGAAAGSEILV